MLWWLQCGRDGGLNGGCDGGCGDGGCGGGLVMVEGVAVGALVLVVVVAMMVDQ